MTIIPPHCDAVPPCGSPATRAGRPTEVAVDGDLVVRDGDGAAVPESGTQRVTVEVHDRFNDPVAGATVHADTAGTDGAVHAVGSTLSEATTDSSGRAVFVYEAPDDVTAPRPDGFDVVVDGRPAAHGRVTVSPSGATVV